MHPTGEPATDIAKLQILRELGSGGQGTVYLATVHGQPPPMAFKQYATELAAVADADALVQLVMFGRQLDPDRAQWLFLRCAWPTSIVLRDGAACGFLMQPAPLAFFASLRMPTGPEQRLLGLEFLLNPPEYMHRVGILVSDRDRILILQDLVLSLVGLHESGIVIGDLSAKNVLVALAPTPRCFVIDCDAVRLRGRWCFPRQRPRTGNCPQARSWQLRRVTATSWVYSAVRLFGSDQSTRAADLFPPITAELADVVRRTLSDEPSERPALQVWLGALTAALPFASTAVPVPPPVMPAVPASPQPARPAPGVPPLIPPVVPQPRTRSRAWIPAIIGVIAVALVCTAVVKNVGSPSASGGGASANSEAGDPQTQYSQEVPAPAPSPRTTTVGIVDFGGVADDNRAADVARMFDSYFSSINSHDYNTALSLYDPSGVVNPGVDKQRSSFIHGVSTTQDTDVSLVRLAAGDGTAVVNAEVTFQSTQQPPFGPKTNPNETCTRWDLQYELTQPGSGRYLILRPVPNTTNHQPC